MQNIYLWRLIIRLQATVYAIAFVAISFGTTCSRFVWSAETDAPPFILPAGFEAEPFAADDLAHDVYSMTLDNKGQVVVSGPGYIKTLHDDNHDGKADRATEYSSLPKSGAHGLLFVDEYLFATGDENLLRFEDRDGNGVADGPPQIMAKLSSSEHGAGGLVLGPDGWIYIACGNDAKVNSGWKPNPSSPLMSAESGAIVRMTPDGTVKEIVAEGFRNPYDLAFGEGAALLTVDSDGERDHHLPWYEPTRAFEVALGAHHGWLLQGWQQSWSRPEHMADNVPRVAEFGRGSPTGVCVYRHHQFPAKYRGGLFSACWTLGRIYYVPLERKMGSGLSPADPEVFLQTSGTIGFAPVDMAVGPTGDLFVAIGGRRTRGGVFCIRYKADIADTGPGKQADAITRLLSSPDPLSAWSRAQWLPLVSSISRKQLVEAALAANRGTSQRIRAIELLTEFQGGLLLEEAQSLVKDKEPAVVVSTLWSIARSSSQPAANSLFLSATKASDLAVQRAGWEGLLTAGSLENTALKMPHSWREEAGFESAWNSNDARLFDASRRMLVRQETLATTRSVAADAGFDPLLFAKLAEDPFDASRFAKLAALLQPVDPNLAPSLTQQLRLLRQLQREIGDVYIRGDDAKKTVGYSANASEEVLEQAKENLLLPVLLGVMQGKVTPAYEEAARLSAMLQIRGKEAASRLLTPIDETSNLLRDLHFLFCLAQLEGDIDTALEDRFATALLRLHHKLQTQGRQPSRNWPLQVQGLTHRFLAKHPGLTPKLTAHELLSLPSQAILFRDEPLEVKQQAARQLLAACRKQSEPFVEVVTPEFVQLIQSLPAEEAVPLARELWDNPALRDVLITILAEAAKPEDRTRFLEGLESYVPATVEKCALALAKLPPPSAESAAELVRVLGALRQACAAPEQRSTRQALVALLQMWTGETLPLTPAGKKESPQDYQTWFEWEKAKFPEALAAAVAGDDSWGGWAKRLPEINWDSGDVKRGEEIFRRQSCIKCHAGSGPLGPSLAGVQKRFSHEDLVRAIVEPSRDVAPPYQVWQVITRDGNSYSGLLIYESPEGTLLQTTPEETLRIAGDNLETLRRSGKSLMPQGLLRGVSDQEIADLLAYLKQISAK